MVDGQPGEDAGDDTDITGMVEQPAKVMRIGTMIKQLLEEVRAAPLDEAGRH
ncbi:MAG: proteasome activator, partial [Pseudonocardiales bacterium]